MIFVFHQIKFINLKWQITEIKEFRIFSEIVYITPIVIPDI